MYDTLHSRGHIQGFPEILYGDKLREKMEEGKSDETFFSAL
jgi:hypothetical protein